MRIDFDTENIRKNEISLLDCQVDLILRSLEFYLYTYRFIYPRRGKDESDEENLRKSLVFDTYNQILNEYNSSKIENPIETNLKHLEQYNYNNGENNLKIA